MKNLHFLTGSLIIALLAFSSFIQAVPVQAANGCASSSPTSGAYTATVCITSPLAGSTLIGNATVTATISITGTNPGVQRMAFFINGAYLLTDFSSPYTFTLPSNKWADGSYTFTASALMRDGFSSTAALLAVTFSNGNSTAPVNSNHFTPSTGTAPASGQPFVVAAAGDGASGEASSTQVINLISSLNPNLFLYLGDVYESGSMTEFYNWYGTSSSNFGVLRAITDPTIGNHEYTNGIDGSGYFDYWNNIPNYYSFNAGGWHFISLNSNYSKIGVTPSSAQYLWLQQDLAANAQACTIVYYHQPLYNIGPEGPTPAMSYIWSLLAQYGVSIVLNGHDHDYQRWVPLDGNGNPSPTGITEFVAGGGGHGLLTIINSDSRVAYSNDLNPAAFGVLLLQLSQTGANFSYDSSNGSILDFGFIPCVKSAPTPTPTPTSTSMSTATYAPSPTPTLAVTSTPTPTDTPTQTPTATQTNTPTSMFTPTPNPTASFTPTPTPTPTPTATQTTVNTPTPTPSPTATTGTSTVTFIPVADTYVNAGSTTTNYGSSTTLRLDASPDVHAYLRFSLSGLAGTTISKALLLLYANNSDSSGIRAWAVSDNTWGELSMNYTNAPALGSQLASSSPFSSVGWVTMDVTSYITGNGTYSIGVTNLSSTAISVDSRESGVNAPQLIITYSGALSPTSTPTPTGTLASTNTPTPTFTPTPTSVFTPTATATPTATPTPTPTSGTVNTPTPTFTLVPTPTATSTPSVSSVTFTPAADTYVDSANPTINHGTSTTLRLDGSPDVHAYLRFTISGFSGTISQVRLLLFANNSDSSGIRAWTVSDNTWGELTMTYSNAPALGTQIASLGSFATGWVTLDVTSYITGNGTYSMGITNLSSTAISVNSRESGANGPQLVISYH